jgi:hypothetical protein
MEERATNDQTGGEVMSDRMSSDYTPAQQWLQALDLMVEATQELATNNEKYPLAAIECGPEMVLEIERVIRIAQRLTDGCDVRSGDFWKSERLKRNIKQS